MLSVGLTGGFASGKTTVAKMLNKKSVKFISADEIVHAILNSPGAGRERILRAFGRDILTAGRIDRHKLGRVVFREARQRKILEKIIHPQVIKTIKAQVRLQKQRRRYAVLMVEVPLLFEAGLEKTFDLTVAVIATRRQQIQRALQSRSLTRQEIIGRMKAQLPLSQKKQLADILIDNRGSFQYTKRQVDRIWRKFQQLESN